MATTDYLHAIQAATTPGRAALYIRAQAACNAATLSCYTAEQRVEIVTQAEQQAQSLERPWSEDAGAKPWRRWLREWGYLGAHTTASDVCHPAQAVH